MADTVLKLGVNVDHVANIRQARRTNEPDPVIAAGIVQLAGLPGGYGYPHLARSRSSLPR